MVKFLQESVEEFKKVEWPSKKETIRLTALVIGVSLIVSLVVMLLDYLFQGGMGYIIRN